MTCIVGIKDGNDVWMGADSMASSPHVKLNVRDGKIFRNGPILFGVCGSFRLMQVLRHNLPIPEINSNDNMEYLCGPFAKTVMDTMKELDVLDPLHGGMPGDALIGFRKGLYVLQSDGSILEPDEDYAATGSGEPYALGSLSRSKGSPRKRLTLALEAASQHCPSVGPPFKIEKL